MVQMDEFIAKSIRFPKTLDEQIQRLADEQHRSFTKQVIHMLIVGVAREQGRRQPLVVDPSPGIKE